MGINDRWRNGYGLLKRTPPRPLAGFEYFLDTGPHIVNLGFSPLMIANAPSGKRQLIGVADSLLIAQLSPGLGARFCECYAVVKSEVARLLPVALNLELA